MSDKSNEVVDWYEKQIGIKLSDEEKEFIKMQCDIEKLQFPKTKDLEEFGIELEVFERGM